MVNFRIIARVFSLVIVVEGLLMLLAAFVSFIYGETLKLILPGIMTVVAGLLVFTPLKDTDKASGQKEGFIIIIGIWLIMSLFGTLPYLMSGTIHNFSDAFFESMSGFTTTGATILTDIESLPRGVLFWRSISQWLGGISFIVISLSVLQIEKSNVQLTITGFTGQPGERIHPKISEAAKRLITIYVILTLVLAVLLLSGGMNIFDSVCHSFSTMSTGGFSTRNAGIASFGSPYILIILTLFMFFAGTNMSVVYFALKGNFSRIRSNNEFLFYTITCLCFIFLSAGGLIIFGKFPAGKAFLEGIFQTVSIISTTGYYHSDYDQWGVLLTFLIFIMMFTGGTSGSASGGLKIIRLLLITRNSRHEMRRMIHPNAYLPVRLDQRLVNQTTILNIIVFAALYFIITCISALIISLMDHDIITSFSTATSMLGNIGPGLNEFGPFSNYSSVPDAGKWFLSLLMMIGRIELFSFLILFTPGFYRR
jgi:trk system potassium uptake protein TrkH